MGLLMNFFALFLAIFLGQGIKATYLSPLLTCETIDCKPDFVCKVISGTPKCVLLPDPCNFACTLEVAPVCGSDGKTYSNKCQLKHAACKEKKDITVSSEGACPISHATGCAAVSCLLPKVCQVINGRAQCVCSNVCPEILAPVCGSDGVTYGNECLLKYAACKQNKKITAASKGPCPQTSCAAVSCILPKVCHVINNRAQCACPLICPAIFAPVCGSDGITYSNLCQLNVAACKENKKITVASKGPCPASSCAAVSCLLPKVCTVVDGRAQCVCPSNCPVSLAPVCGSNSITYSNECELKTAVCKTGKKITVASHGACEKQLGCATMLCLFPRVCKVVYGHPQCACSEICTHEFQPVCRSDGRTFNNECEACSKDKSLVVISKGPCEPKITCANILCTIHHVCKMIGGHPKCINTCPKNCPEVYWPVCGSDGVSYDNECEMKHAACQKGKIINLAQKHPCGKVCFRYKCSSPPYSKCENVDSKPNCVCKFFCDTKQDLVCGSDGVTYNNVCQMEQTACKTNKNIKIASKALCKDPCLEHGPCTSPPYSRCQLFYGKPKCVCNKICTAFFAPVCGSDGKTYSSACKLEVASCTENRKITIKGIGQCFNPCSVAKCGNYATCQVQNGKAVCVCPTACPKILKPVCGTDRQTYNNECLLKVASCKRGKEIIRIASNGRCPSYTPY